MVLTQPTRSEYRGQSVDAEAEAHSAPNIRAARARHSRPEPRSVRTGVRSSVGSDAPPARRVWFSVISRRLAAGIAVALLPPASPLAAQRITGAAAWAESSHRLHDGLHGVAVSLGIPMAARWSVVLTADHLRGSKGGSGIVCGDVIDLDACPVEPFREQHRLVTAGAGADAPLVRGPYVEIAARPRITVGRASANKRGRATDNFLEASKAEVGLFLGIELRLNPAPRIPIAIVLGAETGRHGPVNRVADGYTPFEQWHTIRALHAGGAISWGRAR